MSSLKNISEENKRKLHELMKEVKQKEETKRRTNNRVKK